MVEEGATISDKDRDAGSLAYWRADPHSGTSSCTRSWPGRTYEDALFSVPPGSLALTS